MVISGRLGLINSYYQKGDFEHSKQLAIKLLDHLNENNYHCTSGIKLNLFGRLFWIAKNQNQLNLAIKYIVASEELIEESSMNPTRYNHLKAGFQSYMGMIELELGHFDKAKEKFKDAIDVLNKISYPNPREDYKRLVTTANVYNMYGEVYLNIAEEPNDQMIDTAAYYFDKAFETTKLFVPSHENSETLYQLKLVECLIKKEKFDSALDKLKEILCIW